MIGMNAATGAALAGDAHLAQSMADILSTPLGTRVGRRDYGSALFDLFDTPMNGLGRIRLFAAVANALARWEPRIRITRVGLVSAGAGGAFTLAVDGVRKDDPDPSSAIALTIPLRLER